MKYDNPIANQSTIKSSKKLNWIDSDDSKVTRDNLIKLKDEEIFNYI